MTDRMLPFGSVEGTSWDAVVVGAGPAGTLAARGLALGGARVLLIEKASFPRWKVCGACLNGRALAVLRQAGLESLVECEGGIHLDTFELRMGGRSARLPLPSAVALSRARFDAALLRAALDSGVSCVMDTEAHVEEVRDGRRWVRLTHQGSTIRASGRVVLVAAGLGKSCMDRVEAPGSRVARGSRVGVGCLLEATTEDHLAGTISMAVGRQGYVGLVRQEDGRLNIAAALDRDLLRVRGTPGAAASAVLSEAGYPPLPRLENADWRGTPALTRRISRLALERVFFLGDCAGYVEPLTGEGMAWALASGHAIAPLALRAIMEWSPGLVREWSALHGRLVRRRQLVCRGMAAALRRPALARLAFELIHHTPAAAGLVLGRLNASPTFSHMS
jgi:flavin-dependent dehydrogenase